MINKIATQIRKLSNTDQLIFARLFRDEITAMINGNKESVATLQEALTEWNSLPDET